MAGSGSPSTPQIDAGAPNLVVDYLVRGGMDRAALLAEVGLRPEDLAPGRRVPRAANQRLWMVAAKRTGDPALGLHVAQFARPGVFGLVEYLARTAGSLLAAARRASEFARINHDIASIEVVEEGDRVRLLHSVADGQRQLPEVVDFVIAHLVNLGRQLTGRTAGLQSVHLARPRPEDVTEYVRFFRAPLFFDADQSELVVDGRIALAPLEAADRRLHALLRDQAEQELAALPARDIFLSHVLAVLRESLETSGGRASEVARRLGLSERTLRRRLADLGLSHSRLLDELRRDLAFQLEARRRGSQIDVAIQLGYASAAAYRRAFRRWAGANPSQWRERGGAA